MFCHKEYTGVIFECLYVILVDVSKGPVYDGAFRRQFMIKVKNDLLNGSVSKGLLFFAIPLFISNIFQQLYNTVDTIIVGNYLGEISLAAIGASMAVFQLILGISFGFTNGFGIVIARCFGAGDEKALKESVAASLVIGGVIVFILTIGGMLSAKPMLALLRTPDDIFGQAYEYISIIILFTPVMFFYNLAAVYLRSIGSSIIPLIFLVLSAVINILLDILLITQFDMGVEGAAVSTIIAQSISAVASIVYIWKKEHEIVPSKPHFKWDIDLYKELFTQGLSMMLMFSLVVLGSVILQYGINQMGYLVIAGHTTARRLFSLMMIPLSSMGISMTTFVSQNKGAGKGRRILQGVRFSIILGMCWSLVVTLITWLYAEPIVRLVSGSNNATLVETGSAYIRFNFPFFIVLASLLTTRYSLQGLGEKLTPLISSVMELVIKLIFVLVIIPIIGYTGVVISEPVIWVLMTAQLLVVFYRNPYIKSLKS